MSRRIQLHRSAMTVPEALISLTIMVILMIAMATAFQASASSVESNDAFFHASQAARVCVDQICSELRQCDSSQVGVNSLSIIRPASTLSANESYRTFAYDADNELLTLQIFYANGTSSPVYTLASNVTGFTFGPAVSATNQLGQTAVIRVPLAISVKVGASSVTLHGSASPRRAQIQ